MKFLILCICFCVSSMSFAATKDESCMIYSSKSVFKEKGIDVDICKGDWVKEKDGLNVLKTHWEHHHVDENAEKYKVTVSIKNKDSLISNTVIYGINGVPMAFKAVEEAYITEENINENENIVSQQIPVTKGFLVAVIINKAKNNSLYVDAFVDESNVDKTNAVSHISIKKIFNLQNMQIGELSIPDGKKIEISVQKI